MASLLPAVVPIESILGARVNQPIISVSGLRGIVGESLTPEIAMRYACALAAELPAGPLVITRDGRATGPMLAAAIAAGLMAVGRDVIDADVAATPTTGILVRHFAAAGGIQISASHNPAEYNGLKLFSAAGRVIPEAAGRKVIDRYEHGTPQWVAHDKLGHVIPCSDSTSEHCRLVLGDRRRRADSRADDSRSCSTPTTVRQRAGAVRCSRHSAAR